MELARKDDPGVEGVMARHPEFFRDERGTTNGKAHPSKPGRKVTTRTRAHSPDDEDATDEKQPGKGGISHSEVQRYLRMLPGNSHEKPYGSGVTHRRSE
jgi:hypothetical protein